MFNFQFKPRADALTIASLQVKKHEGLRLKPYNDSVGVLTIGYGRNLSNGIRQDEAELMFKNDLEEAVSIAKRFAGNQWDKMNIERQAVIINMAFNLGESKLNAFSMFKAAIRAGNYEYAAERMRHSLWYKQVKSRGEELAMQMETGEIR